MDELEILQQQFIKRLYKLPRHTPMYFTRLETNRPHIKIQIIKNTLNYWIHILKKKDGTLLKDSYEALRKKGGKNANEQNWTSQVKQILSNIKMDHIWDSQCYKTVKESLDEIIETIKQQSLEEDIKRAEGSTTIPHFKNIMQTSELPEYQKLNLPLPITSTLMQLRLNFDRIVIHNKTLTLKGWFRNDNNLGICTICPDNPIEDLEHFMDHCEILQEPNTIDLTNYKNKEFYNNMTYDSCLQIYNSIIKYFYIRYEDT